MDKNIQILKEYVKKSNEEYPHEPFTLDYNFFETAFRDINIGEYDIKVGWSDKRDDVILEKKVFDDYGELDKTIEIQCCPYYLMLKDHYEKKDSKLHGKKITIRAFPRYNETVVDEREITQEIIEVVNYPHTYVEGISSIEECAALLNKIIKLGIDGFLAHDKVELTDKDREYYHLPKKEVVQESNIEPSTKESYPTQEPLQDIDISNKEISQFLSPTEIQKIQEYELMKKSGITPSDKLTAEIETIYAKIERFRVYREKKQEREEQQRKTLEARAEANEQQNKKWLESYDNSQEKKDKESEELQKVVELANTLSQLNALNPALLTDEQKKLLSDSIQYIKFSELAHKHQDEIGMNPEIRQMMTDYYTEEKNSDPKKM